MCTRPEPGNNTIWFIAGFFPGTAYCRNPPFRGGMGEAPIEGLEPSTNVYMGAYTFILPSKLYRQKWSDHQDLNLKPTAYETAALTGLSYGRMKSDSTRIRTWNLRGRNPLLYPIELWNQNGDDYRARTCDPVVNSHLLYQLS